MSSDLEQAPAPEPAFSYHGQKLFFYAIFAAILIIPPLSPSYRSFWSGFLGEASLLVQLSVGCVVVLAFLAAAPPFVIPTIFWVLRRYFRRPPAAAAREAKSVFSFGTPIVILLVWLLALSGIKQTASFFGILAGLVVIEVLLLSVLAFGGMLISAHWRHNPEDVLLDKFEQRGVWTEEMQERFVEIERQISAERSAVVRKVRTQTLNELADLVEDHGYDPRGEERDAAARVSVAGVRRQTVARQEQQRAGRLDLEDEVVCETLKADRARQQRRRRDYDRDISGSEPGGGERPRWQEAVDHVTAQYEDFPEASEALDAIIAKMRSSPAYDKDRDYFEDVIFPNMRDDLRDYYRRRGEDRR